MKQSTSFKKFTTVLILVAFIFGSMPVEPIVASWIQSEPVVFDEVENDEEYEYLLDEDAGDDVDVDETDIDEVDELIEEDEIIIEIDCDVVTLDGDEIDFVVDEDDNIVIELPEDLDLDRVVVYGFDEDDWEFEESDDDNDLMMLVIASDLFDCEVDTTDGLVVDPDESDEDDVVVEDGDYGYDYDVIDEDYDYDYDYDYDADLADDEGDVIVEDDESDLVDEDDVDLNEDADADLVEEDEEDVNHKNGDSDSLRISKLERMLEINPFLSGTGPVRIAWGGQLPNHAVLSPENNAPFSIPLMVLFTPVSDVYEVGSLEIRIPRFLLEGRDGSGHGEIAQSVGANGVFSWTTDFGTNEVILTNNQAIVPEYGMPIVIEGILYSFSPSHLESGREHSVMVNSAFHDGVELLADGELTLTVETRITPNQNDKDVENGWSNTVEWNHQWGAMPTHLQWDSDWGEMPNLTWEGIDPGDIVDGFFYVNWRIDIGHVNGYSRYGQTTMPWEGHITELPGENGRIVAYQINGGAWSQDGITGFNPDTGNYYGIWPWERMEVGTGSPYDIDSGEGHGTRTINVIMAFPLIETPSGFAYGNCVIWDVRGIDSEMSLQQVVDADEADAVEIVWPGDGYLRANARILRFADHAYRLDPCGPGYPRHWNPALEGDFPFTKRVQAEDDTTWESNIVIQHGDYYTYRLRWENSSNAPIYSLVIFDVFETAPDSEWQGDFRGINVTVPGPALTTPYRIYFSTTPDIDPRGNLAHADLSDASLWTLNADFTGDFEDVTAIAVYFGAQRFGTTQPGSVVYVDIDMQAPAAGHANETARNNGSWRGDASHPEIADEIPITGGSPETEVRIERDGTIIEGDCEGISLGNVVDEEHRETIPGVTVTPEVDADDEETGRMIVVVPGNRNPDNVVSEGPGWAIVGTPEVDEDGYMTIILAPVPDPYCDPVVITVDCDGIDQITIAGVVIDHNTDNRVQISGPDDDGVRTVIVPGSRPSLVTATGPGYTGNVVGSTTTEWDDEAGEYVVVSRSVTVTLTPNPEELFCLDIEIVVDCDEVTITVDGEEIDHENDERFTVGRDENGEVTIDIDGANPDNVTVTAPPGWDYDVDEDDGMVTVAVTPHPDSLYCDPIVIDIDCEGLDDMEVSIDGVVTPPGAAGERPYFVSEAPDGTITITFPGIEVEGEDEEPSIWFPSVDRGEITVDAPPGWTYVTSQPNPDTGNVTVTITPDGIYCDDIEIAVECDRDVTVEIDGDETAPGATGQPPYYVNDGPGGTIVITFPGIEIEGEEGEDSTWTVSVDRDRIDVTELPPGWTYVISQPDSEGNIRVTITPGGIYCDPILIEVDCEGHRVFGVPADAPPYPITGGPDTWTSSTNPVTGVITITFPRINVGTEADPEWVARVDADEITFDPQIPGWTHEVNEETNGDVVVTIMPLPGSLYCDPIVIDVDCEGVSFIEIDDERIEGEDLEDDDNPFVIDGDVDSEITVTFPGISVGEGADQRYYPSVDEDEIDLNLPPGWTSEIEEGENGDVVVTITPGGIYCEPIVIEVDCDREVTVQIDAEDEEDRVPVPDEYFTYDNDGTGDITVTFPGTEDGEPSVDVDEIEVVLPPGWTYDVGDPDEETGDVIVTITPGGIYCDPILIVVDCEGYEVYGVHETGNYPIASGPDTWESETDPDTGVITITFPGVDGEPNVDADEIDFDLIPGWTASTPEVDEATGDVTVVLTPDEDSLYCEPISINVDCYEVTAVVDSGGNDVLGWEPERELDEEGYETGRIIVTIPGVGEDLVEIGTGPGGWTIVERDTDEDGLVTIILEPGYDIYCSDIFIDADCDGITITVDEEEVDLDTDDRFVVREEDGDIIIEIPGADEDRVAIGNLLPGWESDIDEEDGTVTVTLTPDQDSLYCSDIFIDADCDGITVSIDGGTPFNPENDDRFAVSEDEDGNIIIDIPTADYNRVTVGPLLPGWEYDVEADEDEDYGVTVILTPDEDSLYCEDFIIEVDCENVTVNGEDQEFVTDEEGRIIVVLPEGANPDRIVVNPDAEDNNWDWTTRVDPETGEVIVIITPEDCDPIPEPPAPRPPVVCPPGAPGCPTEPGQPGPGQPEAGQPEPGQPGPSGPGLPQTGTSAIQTGLIGVALLAGATVTGVAVKRKKNTDA